VCCEGSGFCDNLITCSDESYRVCVWLGTSTLRRPRPHWVVTPQKKWRARNMWHYLHFQQLQLYLSQQLFRDLFWVLVVFLLNQTFI
jgi:hypothetical protein